MFLTKLALKNLVRHHSRTLITAIIIAFAIFFYIVFDSMIGGMTQMSYNTIIDYESGHIQVANQKYWDDKEDLPLKNLIDDDQIMRTIKSIKEYRDSSPELDFLARLSNGNNELPVLGKGIIPARFTKVFNFDNKFVSGSMFTGREYKAVMGKRLADLLQLKTGDYITLLVKDKNETFNTIDVEIGGLIYTGNPNVNNNTVYLPLDVVQNALNVNNKVSKVIVKLGDKSQAMNVAENLKNKLKSIDSSLNAYSWNQLEAVSVAGAKQMGNKLVMIIILLIAAIAIVNTVILAALERMEEIGMMKAMGLKVKEIIYIFVLESTGIGVLGGIIGIILGIIGVWLLATIGINFGALTNMDMSSFGIPIIGKLYGVWKIKSFMMTFGFGVIVSFLSSILPAYWAAGKDPVQAIYHR